MRTWSRELAGRATVNAVTPGPVGTDMWNGTADAFREHLRSWMERAPGMEGDRPGTVEDVAGVVGMLCRGESG